MPCYSPIRAWRDARRNIAFKPIPDSTGIQLPCGKCIGCKLERSRQWSQRLTDEARFHDRSCFVTLTYSPFFRPKDGSLHLEDFQLFMKRLRKRCGAGIRFFHAGEYGLKFGRPHYHAILFGVDFRDAFDFDRSERGDWTWSSYLLDELWNKGMARVGNVTSESAAYVARYCTKKVTGDKARAHYERMDPLTGEFFQLKAEYATMSRRPGIGRLHVEKYAREIFSRDSVIFRGHPAKPPRFYDSVFAKLDPLAYELLKEKRESALRVSIDRSHERLRVREEVKLAQLGSLKRRYELG